MLLRFLAANGPATAGDVARWWGEQPAPAKRWIRDNADALTPVEVDGEPGFVVRAEDAGELAAVPDGGSDPGDGPALLPGFDPWVLAPLTHRRRAVPSGREAAVSRPAGWVSPVLVVDGTVAGVWDHDRRADALTVTVRPFSPVAAPVRRAVEEHAQGYGTLLGAAPVRVGWTRSPGRWAARARRPTA